MTKILKLPKPSEEDDPDRLREQIKQLDEQIKQLKEQIAPLRVRLGKSLGTDLEYADLGIDLTDGELDHNITLLEKKYHCDRWWRLRSPTGYEEEREQNLLTALQAERTHRSRVEVAAKGQRTKAANKRRKLLAGLRRERRKATDPAAREQLRAAIAAIEQDESMQP